MRYSWKKIALGVFAVVVIVGLRLRANADLASPEISLVTLIQALKKNDQRAIALLTTNKGQATIKWWRENPSASSLSRLGRHWGELSASTTRNDTQFLASELTTGAVVLKAKANSYFVFVPSGGVWKFDDFFQTLY